MWPDGRPLLPKDRRKLQDELGVNPAMQKHPIQREMEGQGLINPGQKWWALTSESVD